MLDIKFSKDSVKFISRLSPKQQQQIALKIIDLRKNNGLLHDSRPLKGSAFYKTDIGEYRIIHEIDNSILHIILIGKRNDDEVYKKFNRKKT